jgi:hypothetical protein
MRRFTFATVSGFETQLAVGGVPFTGGEGDSGMAGART